MAAWGGVSFEGGVPGGKDYADDESNQGELNAEEEDNPFRMPTDQEVFQMRDEERRQREEARDAIKNLHVHEKTTKSADLKATRLRIRDPVKEIEEEEGDLDEDAQALESGKLAAQVRASRRHERQNMASFLAKKREMFLVQMSLDTKRAEIKKLEMMSQKREEQLRKAEQMLEQDALRFDAFLKENDMKAVEAIRKAEAETIARAEKQQEIKKLMAQMMSVRNEMTKYEEQLEDCKKYKEFLDTLTPPEYFKEQEELRKQKEGKDGEGEGKAEDEPVAMYFEKPQQLLDIFAELEENNLFLIQNLQEAEEQLEELRQKLKETKSKMSEEASVLQEQLLSLRSSIRREERKQQILSETLKSGADMEKQEKELSTLNRAVSDVYQRCGFDNDTSLSALTMLTNIEAKLEDMLDQVEKMPVDFVERAERAREKERRQRLRQEKLEEQKQLHEERIRKKEKRTMEKPVQKKTGKPVMFRSHIRRHTKANEKKKTAKKEEEVVNDFFS